MKELIGPTFLAANALEDEDTPRRSYALGLLFIFFVAVIWTASSVCAQYIYTEFHFNSSFLMTYFGFCLFALILPFKYCTDTLGCTVDTCSETLWFIDDEVSPYFHCGEQPDADVDDLVTVRTFDSILRHKGQNWNHGKHFFAALHIAPVMFIANWLFNAALSSTSVASATVIVSTSCVVVYLLAVLAKEEQGRTIKFIGVFLSVVGVALTGWHDLTYHVRSGEDDDIAVPICENCEHVLWGDMLAIISAIAYGAYTIQVRLLCPCDEEHYSIALLLGYMGLVVLVLLYPMALYISTQVDSLTWTILGWIVGRGLLEFLVSEYLHFRSVILTNAMLATMGLGLTIPFAFIADLFLERAHVFGVGSLLGAVTITTGFLLVNFPDEYNTMDKEDDPHPSLDPPAQITTVSRSSELPAQGYQSPKLKAAVTSKS